MTASPAEQPLYVNARQYARILKRRQQRTKLETQGKIPKHRQVWNDSKMELNPLADQREGI